jgi:sortase (surface protein transpeptidase)
VTADPGRRFPAAGARRHLLVAAVVVLALGGAAAIGLGLRDRPAPEPPLTAAGPVAPTPSSAVLPSGVDDVLTRGPLLPTSTPVRVQIPALRVDVPLTGLGLQADGSMQVPTDARSVGWYTRAPTPGSLGPAVLAGHVNFKGHDGTFARLSTLHTGDPVTVTRQDGTTATFAVTAVDRYAKDRFPSAAVYGAVDHAALRLITCGGPFDSASGHYTDNIVVYADLQATGHAR